MTIAGISNKAVTFGDPVNKKKYQNYELNSDFDLNLYESFYRLHDPQLGRFWQVDPKPTHFESLYITMGNNPILNFDILGDTIVFPGARPEFIAMFEQAADFLTAHGVGKRLQKLKDAKQHISVVETDDMSSSFDHESNTIFWDPLASSVFSNEQNNIVEISPAAILDHEVDHALGYITNPKAFLKRLAKTVAGYDNEEEKRVITGSEQETALALGYIKKGGVTRKDHQGGGRSVDSPIDVSGKTKSVPLLIEDMIKKKTEDDKKRRELENMQIIY